MSDIAKKNNEYKLDDIIKAECVHNSLCIYEKYYCSYIDGIDVYKNMTIKNIKQVLLSKYINFRAKLQIIKNI